jgi:hypothetical protein
MTRRVSDRGGRLAGDHQAAGLRLRGTVGKPVESTDGALKDDAAVPQQLGQGLGGEQRGVIDGDELGGGSGGGRRGA